MMNNAELFHKAVEGKMCRDIVHPWNASCVKGVNEMMVSCLKGTGKLSLALHTIQLLSKGRNLTKEHVKYVLDSAIRMWLMGTSMGVTAIGVSCVQRKLYGRFFYHTTMFVPGLISGASIFLIQKAKRRYIISTICAAALETFLICTTPLKTSRQCYLKTQTLLFMMINGAFLYLMKLWKTNKIDKTFPQIWFYSPSAKKNIENTRKSISCHSCNHLHSCFKCILKETSNYFWFGTILETLRITVFNFGTMVRDPSKIFKFVFKKSTLRLGAFASVYAFLYKVTNCLLCRLSGEDDAINALVSGFVSGLSYYIYPNLSLALTAFTNLIHISWKYFDVNEYFGEFPTSELAFMFALGFLLHYHMHAPEYCTRIFITAISLGTNGRSDELFNGFIKLVRK